MVGESWNHLVCPAPKAVHSIGAGGSGATACPGNLTWQYVWSLHIPRPSHCPGFDHLQYIKPSHWLHYCSLVYSRTNPSVSKQTKKKNCINKTHDPIWCMKLILHCDYVSMLTVCIPGHAYKIITQHANRDGSVTNTEEGYIYCDARMYKCKLFLSINGAN